MKKRLIAIILAILLVASGSISVFADSGDSTILEKSFYSDYLSETELTSSTFNAGEFNIDLTLNGVQWLGLGSDETRTGNFKFRNNAPEVNLYEKIPNLKTFALSEEIAQTSLVGYTFNCSNIGGSWDVDTGAWSTSYNDPVGRIRTALDEAKSYLTTSYEKPRTDGNLGAWTDNKLSIKKGTIIQYGNSVIEFTKNVTIDDLYDPVKHEDSYQSQLAYIMKSVKNAMTLSTSSDRKILFFIPETTLAQFSETKLIVSKDITIEIVPGEDNGAEPLVSLYDAIGTADGSARTKYSGYTCDSEAIMNGLFDFANELIGVLAQGSTVITAGEDGSGLPDSTETFEHNVSAVVRINSSPVREAACTHSNTRIEGKMDPTFRTVGYTGDVVCADCGKMIKEGTMIPKKPSSIQLNATSLKLKVKQSSSALKVTYVNGDSIKSVTSSKTKVVQASQSGTNKIKLKAGKKPGKAVVTVVLASGKKASVNVTVQKGAVKCTGIKVTNGTKVNLKKGKTYTIKAERKPITCVQKITYKSSNKKVATVTSKGKVKAKKKGSATIRIKCGSKTKKVKITVK